ncbi:M24 family metallopeptidase [Pseudalkalibacillus salsuginis]|uniref:M24 family metallopeptidase n=1 Tax=Pseudalkalibacillus salsuginis TaxID=2910972 RepID=UPI001F46CB84|nr:Xaa-Pro peptidase family protein [Pseudalkalibacillus salsuginis]MCF6409097.1 Xaa-Pro peptidase family protein [Pseudalkalibacillus salsuginis]
MDKLKSVRNRFEEVGIDGMVITSRSNRRYMTNFTGSAGIVIISEREAKLLTDSRYEEQAGEQAVNYEVVLYKRSVEELAEHVEKMGIKKLGIEKDYMTYGEYLQYRDKINVELVPLSGVIERLREIKSEEEINTIREAAKITDKAFTHIVELIRPGLAEKQVANELEYIMRKEGATSSGSDTIVASGYRSALPHGVASEKTIEKGEMVTLDFGAYYNGYRSDMTRTVAVGDPGEKLREVYQIVLEALNRGLSGIKPGLSTKEVDALPRDFIKAKGYGEYFGHGAGHGIGLDIHENPFFSTTGNNVVQAGMVVTVEPGIYLPGIGGVRIEDDILITDNGIEVLTHSPKELLVL